MIVYLQTIWIRNSTAWHRLVPLALVTWSLLPWNNITNKHGVYRCMCCIRDALLWKPELHYHNMQWYIRIFSGTNLCSVQIAWNIVVRYWITESYSWQGISMSGGRLRCTSMRWITTLYHSVAGNMAQRGTAPRNCISRAEMYMWNSRSRQCSTTVHPFWFRSSIWSAFAGCNSCCHRFLRLEWVQVPALL